jgi:hypothetical protein
MKGGEMMKNNKIWIFAISLFVLYVVLAPIISQATQVTPTFRWSPASPEEVIKQFFCAQSKHDYNAIKEIMMFRSKDLSLPNGENISLTGWEDYYRWNFAIDKVKWLKVTKLDMYSDPCQKIECYQVTGDFEFLPCTGLNDGPMTFFVYLYRDVNDIWKIYAPETSELGLTTRIHQEEPSEKNGKAD